MIMAAQQGEPSEGSIPLKEVTTDRLVTFSPEGFEVITGLLGVIRDIQEQGGAECADHLLRRIFVGDDVVGYFPGDEEAISFE